MFVAVALPSLAYRDASEYNADLEGLQDKLFCFLTLIVPEAQSLSQPSSLYTLSTVLRLDFRPVILELVAERFEGQN